MRNSLSRRSLIAAATLIGAALLPLQVWSAPSQCESSYHNGQRPDILNKRLEVSARELCHDFHAVWYSGVARTPLWAAAYLTKGRVQAARGIPRSDDFREDTRLPSDWRSRLTDYRGSGYDRGHLVPAASFPTPGSVSESFLLSNIVPQDPTLNRSLWAAIEKAVRAHANYEAVYTITGVLFVGERVERLKKRVLVPTHMYKLVYEPARNAAAAYLVENAPNKRHKEVSLAELERLAGVKFLPGTSQVKELKLPRPRY